MAASLDTWGLSKTDDCFADLSEKYSFRSRLYYKFNRFYF